MNLVTSIESIEKKNIIETACKPIRVLCSDLEFYYCKYNAGYSIPNRLLREYLSSCFLQAWHLPAAEVAFIKILKEHIPADLGIPFKYFENTCFGSRKLDNAIEVSSFLTEATTYQKRKIKNKFDYLKIALFDIWVGNDDRNHNNYNLLLRSQEGVYSFIPIDHERVFNTGNLDKPLYTITEESSLITAPLCGRLFTARELTDRKWLENLIDDFYLCIKECIRLMPKIVQEIPQDWQVDIEVLQQQINTNLFAKEWLNECQAAFISYLQLAVNKMEK